MQSWREELQADTSMKKNPLYPEESYEQFIAALIDKKKKKIERVLDLQ